MMDLSKYSFLDLVELRSDLDKAFKEFDKRSKTQVFAIFLPYDKWHYFLKKENAEAYIQTAITENEIFLAEEFKAKIEFLDEAGLQYCEDKETIISRE